MTGKLEEMNLVAQIAWLMHLFPLGMVAMLLQKRGVCRLDILHLFVEVWRAKVEQLILKNFGRGCD